MEHPKDREIRPRSAVRRLLARRIRGGRNVGHAHQLTRLDRVAERLRFVEPAELGRDYTACKYASRHDGGDDQAIQVCFCFIVSMPCLLPASWAVQEPHEGPDVLALQWPFCQRTTGASASR